MHQSFPGQYQHIVLALLKSNHRIVALGVSNCTLDNSKHFHYVQYQLNRGNTSGIHPWLLDLDSKLIRGEACARAAYSLKAQGFSPDIICAHPGWGESLFLKEIWPNCPLLSYQEFFYNSSGFDSSFDPEFISDNDWTKAARIHLKNANPLLALQTSAWNVTPTEFQRSSFPSIYSSQFSVIHDGVNIHNYLPREDTPNVSLSTGQIVSRDDINITFVNRHVEPYRGCHTFIRAIPLIQQNYPESNIFIVGETEGVSYGEPGPNNCWSDVFLSEIKGKYDPSRVFFVGSLDYKTFTSLLRLSSCHVYLTYPFVLSWSLLEAMSLGLAIVGSATSPVEEVITHEFSGLLVDFFSPSQLADSVCSILGNTRLSNYLGSNARKHVIEQYSLELCVPRHLALIDLVASGSIR